MAPSDAKYEKLQSRDNYPRNWIVDLSSTCYKRPGYCCFATFCGWCASYSLRKQALYGDMSRYVCCNGACPCSGRCGEQNNPECCLCLEVACCFAQSVASTRWMIQDELRIQNTQCDNCIIGTMIAAQYLACLCSIAACLTGSEEIGDLAQFLDCIADILWYTVCGCMQTQHKAEMDNRDAGGGAAGGPGGAMQAPGVQMIPMGQPAHGQAYPPGQAPYQGYPPAQGMPQGYPAAAGGGYPPQGPPPGYPAPGQPGMYR